ncbi:MAG TPA: AAA family ATPase [Candidatus Paceibacterota bacterium]|nr:AAA family ATPase [Candidatus Paceibacterota bacterium]
MLKSIELSGFKSFGRKSELSFSSPIVAVVGPNGSGKSNVAEAFRFVLGEQSMKSMRSKKGEDLIWAGSSQAPRANRASVKVVFDNESHALPLDFPEVVIERAVFRDGANEYSINGSPVRLRDVAQLLAQANVGASGYHIISQGEADRVLAASPRERREMVEEALGLKLFQSKKIESEKKLEETDRNLHEVGSLRRELAPHLRYLGKQMERIEAAKELADSLSGKLATYLAREHGYLTRENARATSERHALADRLAGLTRALAQAQATVAAHEPGAGAEEDPAVQAAKEALSAARAAREEASRALGRAEGELSALRAAVARPSSPAEAIAAEAARAFADDIERGIDAARAAESLPAAHDALAKVADRVAAFRREIGDRTDARSPMADAAHDAANTVQALMMEFENAQVDEREREQALAALQAKADEGREAFHAAQRDLIAKTGELRETEAALARADAALADLARSRERFEEEVREGVALIGGRTMSYQSEPVPPEAASEDRRLQEDRRREIERLKVRIEEYRGGNADEVMKEYRETKERDEFLARETEDLSRSAEQLREIIAELESSIDERFRNGLALIQKEFSAYFAQLFGGGTASLTLEAAKPQADGDAEAQPAGLAVSVQLPKKQARGLETLSGGERALTSIALIFAMSQVNPPPFLILDETDAALDEANSRRYAQIMETLAKRSQLIVITHNRATMAAAGELYGVTMGADGVSKLLSVKLEEAQAVAK